MLGKINQWREGLSPFGPMSMFHKPQAYDGASKPQYMSGSPKLTRQGIKNFLGFPEHIANGHVIKQVFLPDINTSGIKYMDPMRDVLRQASDALATGLTTFSDHVDSAVQHTATTLGENFSAPASKPLFDLSGLRLPQITLQGAPGSSDAGAVSPVVLSATASRERQ